MLNLTRKVDYAVLLLTHLGLNEGRAISAREVASSYRLSPSLTANVLKRLGRAGIATSTRGSRGGYVLSRDPEAISIGDVIAAVEGDWGLVGCCMASAEGGEDLGACESSSVCIVRETMGALGAELRAVLERATIGDFVERARKRAVGRGPCAGRSAGDFVPVETLEALDHA